MTRILSLCFLLIASAIPAHAQDLAQARAVILETRAELGDIYQTNDGAEMFAQRVATKLVCLDSRWGRKSTNNGPLSKDTIAYRTGALTSDGRNTPMNIYDFCRDCGNAKAELRFWAAQFPNTTNQRFRPVTGTCAPPPPPGGGEPPPPPPSGDVLTELKRVNTKLDAILERLAAQEANTVQLNEALVRALRDLQVQIERGVRVRF